MLVQRDLVFNSTSELGTSTWSMLPSSRSLAIVAWLRCSHGIDSHGIDTTLAMIFVPDRGGLRHVADFAFGQPYEQANLQHIRNRAGRGRRALRDARQLEPHDDGDALERRALRERATRSARSLGVGHRLIFA